MSYLDKLSRAIEKLPDIPVPPRGYHSWKYVPAQLKDELLYKFKMEVEPIRKNISNNFEYIYCVTLYNEGIISKLPKLSIFKRLLLFFM